MRSFYFFIVFLETLAAFSQHPEPVCKTLALARAEQAALTSQRLVATANTSNYDVQYYCCNWKADPAVRYIEGAVTLRFLMRQGDSRISLDLHDQLVTDSVRYHGRSCTFDRPGNHVLTIQFPSLLATGVLDSVTVYYKGIPASSGFGSFVNADHAGVPVVWTLSEPYGARDWWPCKMDLTDKADSVDIIITCAAAYRASSNGMPVAETVNGNTRVTVFHHPYPIAAYLIGMAITNYERFDETVALHNGPLPVLTYHYPEYRDMFIQNSHYTTDNLKRYERLIGPYPFERYGNTQWGWGGGMEHQTNSFILFSEDVLCAHELAHQWFGNKITCASFKDIWLNEGFATYMSYLQFEETDSAYYQNNILAVMNEHITAQPGGSLIVDDTGSVGRIFDGRLSYEKGSYVLRMLRGVMGDSIFFKGLRAYLNDPALAYGFARTEDFRKGMERTAGFSLREFFNDWVYGEGFPSYQLLYAVRSDGLVSLQLHQTTSHPSVSFFEMPVPLRFRKGQQQITLVANHQFNGQSFLMNPGFIPDTIEIDPERWIISNNNRVEKTTYHAQPYGVTVGPNPFQQQFSISVTQPPATAWSIAVYNTQGQLMWFRNLSLPVRPLNFMVPTQWWASGMYVLQIREANGAYQHVKLIKLP